MAWELDLVDEFVWLQYLLIKTHLYRINMLRGQPSKGKEGIQG